MGIIGKTSFALNVAQHVAVNDHPVAIIRAIRSIVHEGNNAKQAHDVFLTVKEEESKKAANA